MLEESWHDDGSNYDYLEKDVDMGELMNPSSNINDLRGEADNDLGEDETKPLHVQIPELEVELLIAK